MSTAPCCECDELPPLECCEWVEADATRPPAPGVLWMSREMSSAVVGVIGGPEVTTAPVDSRQVPGGATSAILLGNPSSNVVTTPEDRSAAAHGKKQAGLE